MTVALVTGGGRGIGSAICKALAADGYDLAINYSGSEQAALQTAEECKTIAQTQGVSLRAQTFRANIANPEEVEGLFEAVEQGLEAPAILINNAGITRDNLLMRMPNEDFDDVLDTNLKGAFYCTKRATRAMMKSRWGRIVNISSVVGISGNPGQANYAASKAGLIGLTKAVAREVATRNITVNAVAPGFIETAMTDALDEKTRDALLEGIPQKRIGTAEDVATLVSFLCSDKASYITGQVIAVDGGMTT